MDRAVANPAAETQIAKAEAKILFNELAIEATNKLFELAGTRSTLAEHGLDRHWRNAQVQTRRGRRITAGLDRGHDQQRYRDASKSLQHINWFEAGEMRGHVGDGKVAHYQVTPKIGFTLKT